MVTVANKKKVRELTKEFRIQVANAQTVQLALEVSPDHVLADEEDIRRLAEEVGFKIRGCLGMLIDGTRRRLLSVSEARRAAEKLRTSGYRISTEMLKTFYTS